MLLYRRILNEKLKGREPSREFTGRPQEWPKLGAGQSNNADSMVTTVRRTQ
ncbi:hypothetical protein predicted by Glimmer/Critica (plasmid) [Sinorhizobium fredii HH103]|uniref:Uncharacterized protein n=1 Tax=Sinorhizobium fredii (strain HH103) TaxID=1117943 RepID=G9AJI8_SINF1|nr:hypothetical protein predicted by Glimmer/Critica [Sinorhizobium fredii HH103]